MYSSRKQFIQTSRPTSSLQKLDLNSWTIWLVQIVSPQSQTNLSVGTVHFFQRVSQFELFIHVFEHSWYEHWWQVFFSTKVFRCNDQLIVQAVELVEICFSHCKFLNQVRIYVVVFLQHFKFYIQVIGINLRPRKSTKSVLTFSKVHQVCTKEVVSGSSSVVSHKVWSMGSNAVRWKKWFILEKES